MTIITTVLAALLVVISMMALLSRVTDITLKRMVALVAAYITLGVLFVLLVVK